MDLYRLSEKRQARFKEVISKRQVNMTVVLENVHDAHNIGAVMRSCDSVGIQELFVVYTDPRLIARDNLILEKGTSTGVRKWLDIRFYTDLDACMQAVKEKYDRIYSTHLAVNSKNLYELDLSESIALLFGNESEGLTKEALAYSDGNFIIPQVGMAQSLNISVACAVTLYEAYRQREKAGMYTDKTPISELEATTLFKSYYDRHTAIEPKGETRKIK